MNLEQLAEWLEAYARFNGDKHAAARLNAAAANLRLLDDLVGNGCVEWFNADEKIKDAADKALAECEA